jgi:hypothetical protein
MKRIAICHSCESPSTCRSFRTGISLHSHTSASREQLSFLSGFKGQFPVIPAVLRAAAWQHRRATGEVLDIARAGWHPPLDSSAALEIEAAQIHGLELYALVSLTDHDYIPGNPTPTYPLSVEWTVPFGPTFFHIGVHNLPFDGSWSVLQRYTARPTRSRLLEALELIGSHPETLIVLNHPMWDEAGIGAQAHLMELRALLESCGDWIHAIELNGLRSLAENAAAARLASDWDKPLVSGGDRHGAEPNANINLSNARTFSEFVEEVRRDGQSAILYLPQYREPLRLRWLQTVWDIVRSYPEAEEGARHWSDRFFYCCQDGVERSVAQVWKTAQPLVLRQTLALLRLALTRPFRPALRLVLADRSE